MTNRYIQELKEILDAEPKPDPTNETAWESVIRLHNEDAHEKRMNLIMYGHSGGYDALTDELKARYIPPLEKS